MSNCLSAAIGDDSNLGLRSQVSDFKGIVICEERSDKAIQRIVSAHLECFVERVIRRRPALTRWLATTREAHRAEDFLVDTAQRVF